MADNIKKFKRGLPVEPLQPGDMADVITIALTNISKGGGMPATFDDTEQGLKSFCDTSKEYFLSIAAQNRAADEPSQMLIPSVEMWCSYLSISRQTLLNYERRGDAWRDAVQFYKTLIYSVKGELANHGKLSPVLLIFDACNNYNYANTSEFKIMPVQNDEQADNERRIAEIVKRLEIEEAVEPAQVEDKDISKQLDDYLL